MPQRAKSAALHVLEGNPNNITKKELYKRKKNEAKLSVSADAIIPPTWLDSSARDIFYSVVNVMQPTKILTNADIDLIAIYSDTYKDYLSFKNQVKKNGMMIDGRINPFVKQKQKTGELLNKYANQLGLTPSARASLAINMNDSSSEEEDEFE